MHAEPFYEMWQFWATCAGMFALMCAALVVMCWQTANDAASWRTRYSEEYEAFFKWRFPAAGSVSSRAAKDET